MRTIPKPKRSCRYSIPAKNHGLIKNGAALLLAGGQSSRMGANKALLPFGKTTVLDFMIARLQQACEEVILVTTPAQTYAHAQVRKVFDVVQGKSGLGGLYSGLLQSPAEINFVCGCDMPLIAPELVQYLFAQLADYEAVVPQIEGYFEPLCAVYSKACLPYIAAQLQTPELRMTSWLAHARVRMVGEEELRAVDPLLHSFLNMNTPEDYARMRRLV
jgi:molybdopterin-guanine dinucleotide biosynthesis protein A